MDHIKILKRAWRILWSYKTLWIFGIILALTAGRPNGSQGAQFSGNGNGEGAFQITPPPAVRRELGEAGRMLGQFFNRIFAEGEVAAGLIALVIGLACLGLLLGLIAAVARYVAETSLIELVDDYERTEERRTFREGWRMGWSRTAWRLFLIGLVVTLPIGVAAILLLGLAGLPLLGWLSQEPVIGVLSTVVSIGLLFLVIFLLIIVGVVARVLVRLARRACALEDLAVFDSIGRGWDVIRGHVKDVGLMWLIVFGIRLAFTVVMIPVVLLLLALAGISGGLVVLLVRGIAGLFATGGASWIIGGIAGAPIFFLVFGAPLLFVGGLRETYVSTVWTLTFRELTAMEVAASESEPGDVRGADETAPESAE